MKRILLLIAAVATCIAGPALAQKYPNKPIRLVAPFSPGGGSSIIGRMVTTPVSEVFGQGIVIDNRPGAGGAIGAEIAVRATPDGYTLIIVSSSYCATSAYRRLPYDPVKDIQPVVLIGTTGLIMIAHPSVPAKNVKELIALMRSQPGKLNYASVGNGSVTHLGLEFFKIETNTNMVHVPYKGSGPGLVGVVSGEVQISAFSMVPTLPHVKAGRLRALAVTSPRRSPLMPDTPTVSETVPGFEIVHWYGIWGPKGIPKGIVSKWNREVAKVVRQPAMKERLQAGGIEPAGGPPKEFRDLIDRDVKKWNRVIDTAKIKRVG
ncbi:MAG: tripartite tricarboxylate transporter substrate binding protein [Betaproteobacteria bacterium]|nr:tripartite tricarboxylate transporter substrate binding protein [Betaproteobacteria bacterium]MDH3436725.1 tripartite tricarboxylate transporter substrate binding protein [Betaproteobacteria bacterium]